MILLQAYVDLWLTRFNANSNTNSNSNTIKHSNLIMSSYLHDNYLIEFGNASLIALFPSSNNNNDDNAILLHNLTDIIKSNINNVNNDKNSAENNSNNDDNNNNSKQDSLILNLNNVNDLIIFGIDNHCDSGLVPYIQSFKREEITDCLADLQSEYRY